VTGDKRAVSPLTDRLLLPRRLGGQDAAAASRSPNRRALAYIMDCSAQLKVTPPTTNGARCHWLRRCFQKNVNASAIAIPSAAERHNAAAAGVRGAGR
jgi:hypothetical protein